MQSMDEPGTLRHVAVIEFADAPIAWFYERLGFDSCVATEVPEESYLRALTGDQLSSASIKKFSNGRGGLIEVISVPDRLSASLVWNHIAISVSDCSGSVRELTEGGASLVGGPICSPSGPYKVAYIRDPSGNLVELVERL